MLAARVKHEFVCSADITKGSPNVYYGAATEQVLPIINTEKILSLIGTGILIAAFGIEAAQMITGDHKMQCMIFGDIVSFAPQIKNWWQAIALGTSNFIGEVLKNMMYGAAIGSGAAILTGGPAVLAEFGLSNIGANWLATWGGWGLGLRGLMGAQSILGAYGNTGTVTGGDVVGGALAMEIGTAKAAGNILSGRGTVDDFSGVAMWMMPAPKGNRRGANEEV